MAIRGLPMNTTADFVSAADPDAGRDGGSHGPGATVFKVRALDSFAETRVADAGIRLGGDGAVEFLPTRADLETVRLGLVGWLNFTDANGDAISFTTETVGVVGDMRDVAARSSLAVLPLPLVRELAAKIKSFNIPPALTIQPTPDGNIP